MIHEVYSDLPTFKSLSFHKGLNVLLADQTPGASQQQTRNGVGKTSLVEIVHFLLGANCDPSSLFRVPELVSSTFSMDVDLGGDRLAVSRSGNRPSRIIVSPTPNSRIQPSRDSRSGQEYYQLKVWKELLGELVFNLVSDDLVSALTFRSVFPYFARRQGDGGFESAVKSASGAKQQIGDRQTALTYLLDLDWTIPARWQGIRDQERSFRELKKAATEGALKKTIGSVSDLRTELTILDAKVKSLASALAEFRVLDEYRELEQEAARLTSQLSSLSDENTLDRQLVRELTEMLSVEEPPEDSMLANLYKEVGIVLPDEVRRRFAEVQEFHDSVVRNRRSYLEQEIASAEARIRERESEKASADARRAEVMRILRGHGALDSFQQLQSEHTKVEAAAEAVRQRYNAAKQLESQQTQLKLDRQQLLSRLQQDHAEQESKLGDAILLFEELSQALYGERKGSLHVEETMNGPEFSIRIHGQDSKGISNMQVYCFDMMLAQLAARRGIGPGFLIHDSHLFDGVESRQVSTALRLGAEISDRLGFQYIVTMNSDSIPSFEGAFDVTSHILPVRLTDKSETGGLFGLRFK